MKRLVGFEKNFNGIYFHHHFYVKTPQIFFVYCLALKIYSDVTAKLPFSDTCTSVENNKFINSFEIIMTLVTIVQMVLIL